jgi:hypothetical protein
MVCTKVESYLNCKSIICSYSILGKHLRRLFQSEIWEAVMVNKTTLRNQKSKLSIAVDFDEGDIIEFTAVERQQKVNWKGSMGFPIQSIAYIHI